KTMLVPEALSTGPVMPQAHRDLYSYANSVMEPWDGPAALAAYDGRWVIGGMDRNGLRPMRYTVTTDGLLIAGSETGMVKIDEIDAVEKGRLGPGQMIAVDLGTGKLYKDTQIKDHLAARRPFSDWTQNTTALDTLVRAAPAEPAELSRDVLRRR